MIIYTIINKIVALFYLILRLFPAAVVNGPAISNGKIGNLPRRSLGRGPWQILTDLVGISMSRRLSPSAMSSTGEVIADIKVDVRRWMFFDELSIESQPPNPGKIL